MINRTLSKCKSDKIIKDFQKACRLLPVYMCAVCNRYLFRKQVIKFVGEKYKSSVIVLRCLTGSELHLPCEKKCQFCAQWICVTYHKKLKEGHIPNQSMANNLKQATQTTFLSELNPLEQHLVSRVIPFMKIVTLPKSLQKE